MLIQTVRLVRGYRGANGQTVKRPSPAPSPTKYSPHALLGCDTATSAADAARIHHQAPTSNNARTGRVLLSPTTPALAQLGCASSHAPLGHRACRSARPQGAGLVLGAASLDRNLPSKQSIARA